MRKYRIINDIFKNYKKLQQRRRIVNRWLKLRYILPTIYLGLSLGLWGLMRYRGELPEFWDLARQRAMGFFILLNLAPAWWFSYFEKNPLLWSLDLSIGQMLILGHLISMTIYYLIGAGIEKMGKKIGQIYRRGTISRST